MKQRLPIVLSVTALIVAILGWTSVGEAAKNLITGKDIKNNSVTGIDIRNGSLRGADVRDNSLTGRDVRDGTLKREDFSAGGALSGDVTIVTSRELDHLGIPGFAKYTATCPPGTQVVGGGGDRPGISLVGRSSSTRIPSAAIGAVLAASFPASNSSWSVIWTNVTNLNLTAYAVCAG